MTSGNLAKAATNYFAGALPDRHGRKQVLVAGWLIAVPVPLLRAGSTTSTTAWPGACSPSSLRQPD
jgi:MFS family permease